MFPGNRAPGTPDGLFATGGEAARIMAALDWTDTPVGPVESWPASLRFAVRTVLVSKYPMVLTWGPEFTQFYNDAYTPFIGAKHPAIGDDIRTTLAEGWEALGPPIEHAMSSLEASWLPEMLLLLDRAGYREETYFTVSHAPAFDDAERVAGMHAVCTEVTAEVLGTRRQSVLHELATVGGRLGAEHDTVTAMCSILASDTLDVPFAAVYLSTPGEPGFQRVAAVGCDAQVLPVTVGTDTELVGCVDAMEATGGPFGDRVCDAVVLPLTAARDGEPLGFLLAGCSPNLAQDGEYRSFHELVAAQFAGAVVTIRLFEAERLRAESLAELDRAKTTFFSNVSHELRTPLTLLLGPIGDVLANATEPLPAGARDELELALRNGQRLKRLVNDLLDFASIEAGRANPVRVETDVATFTAELAGIFRAATERAGLRLTVDCPPLTRPAYVDPRMWEKVVVNLLANAVKYTFVGGIDVTLRAADDGFRLTVGDTGVGIVAEELPHLFERFHRVSDATARTREGTGIGLALVQELTALHAGAVAVTSEPGRGSTFTVTLPYGASDVGGNDGLTEVRPSDAARGEAASWEQDTTRPAEPATASDFPAGILVVDDNADMRSYLVRLLGAHWAVRSTANGEEALQAVADRQPDLVLTDVMMPRMDGFELLAALRADPATQHIPVIMLTARAGQEASVEGLEAGADDYLAKPFRADELIARVRVALDRGEGRAAQVSPGAAIRPTELPGPVHVTVPVARGPGAVVPEATAAATIAPPPRLPVEPPESSVRLLGQWRLPSEARSVPLLRRQLRGVLDAAELDHDQAYDLLLAAGEAVTNAIEHAQEPSQPFVDVAVAVRGERLEIMIRDFGQWRERVPSMDRGRGSTLMSAFADVTATPSPTGTTVVISSRLVGLPA